MPDYEKTRNARHQKDLQALVDSKWELVVSVRYYKSESPVTKNFSGKSGGAKAATDKAASILGRLHGKVYHIKQTIKLHPKAGGTYVQYDRVMDGSRTVRPSDQPKSRDVKFW